MMNDVTEKRLSTVRLTAAFTSVELDGPALVTRALKATTDRPVENPATFQRNPPPSSLHALGRALRGLDLISDAVWTDVLARATDLPAIGRKALDACHALPAEDPRRPQFEFMRARNCVVFRRSAVSETHWVATADPEDRFALTLLRQMSETPPEICVASEADILATIDRLYTGDAVGAQPEGDDDLAHMLARAQEGPVVRYVNATISAAGASDIHFEPSAQGSASVSASTAN